jgi:hypothetical protein
LIVKVTIDGIEYDMQEGANILFFCIEFGIFIPHLCYLKRLSPFGKCGVCVVETNDNGLQLSCLLTAKNDLKIITDNESIQKTRKRNLNRILKNHNISCYRCSKNGWCMLQKTTVQIYNKEKHIDNFEGNLIDNIEYLNINENIIYDKSKCIFCSKCVKFIKEVCGERIATPEDLKNILDNNLLGNVIDICPTAALNQSDINEKNSLLNARTENTFDISNIFTPPIKTHIVGEKIVKISNHDRLWIKDELRFVYKNFSKRNRRTEYTLDQIIDILKQKINESNNEKSVFLIGDNIDILSFYYIKYLPRYKKNILISINDYNVPQQTTEDLLENIEKLPISDHVIIIKPNSISETINILSEIRHLKNKTIIDKKNLNSFIQRIKSTDKVFPYISPCVILFYNAFEDKNILNKTEELAKIYQKKFNIQLKVFVIPHDLTSILRTFLKEYIPLSELFVKFNKHDLRFICQIGDTQPIALNPAIFYVKNSVFESDLENGIHIPARHFLEDSCFYLNIFKKIVRTNGTSAKNLISNREFLFALLQAVFEEDFYDINEEIQNKIRNKFLH